jgi:hypothetical protein
MRLERGGLLTGYSALGAKEDVRQLKVRLFTCLPRNEQLLCKYHREICMTGQRSDASTV